MGNYIKLEKWSDGQWVICGELTLPANRQDKSQFIYDSDYCFDDGLPVTVTHEEAVISEFDYPTWPPFIVDILPQGYNRRQILKKHDIADIDRDILLYGAANPPGNLRIVSDTHITPNPIECDINLLSSLTKESAMIYLSGGTDLQGDAPKFMLIFSQDKWYFDNGAILPNPEHYIIKFPRGQRKSDKQILDLEERYIQIAHELGVNVSLPDKYRRINNALLIPRFDRIANQRLAMESLYSACELIGGDMKNLDQFECCRKIYDLTGTADLLEYIRRDILNDAFGNTDNHARNTAFLTTDAGVRLSPLYDFAPMILDEAVIIRSCKWADCETGYYIDWPTIFDRLERAYREIDFSDLRQLAQHLKSDVQNGKYNIPALEKNND